MFGTLALAVRMVGQVEISLANLHAPACPALREVELHCADHGDGWVVHVWPVDPPAYQPYAPTNRRQADLIDLFAIAGTWDQ